MALSTYRKDESRRTWTARAPLDPMMRRQIHGPIRPMEGPSILGRLFGRH